MFKKITALTLAALFFTVSAFAAVTSPEWTDGTSKIESLTIDNAVHTPITAWDGETVSESLKGTGKEDSPYEIATGGDLAKFAALVNGGETSAWAVLTSDIDMGSVNWVAEGVIGSTNAYTGTFNGQGYAIYNLYTTSTGSATLRGLFGILGGTVKNLRMINYRSNNQAKTNGNSKTGAVCATLSGGTIENVTVTGEIYNRSDSTTAYLIIGGGIAGMATGTSSIINCSSSVDIDLTTGSAMLASSSLSNAGIGGILGTAGDGASVTVTNCGYSGNINAPNNTNVGGIVGFAKGTYGTVLTINNCCNTGNITASTKVAGILGWSNTAGAFATNGYNTGTITARNTTTPWASGIANNVQRTASTAGYFYSSGDVLVKATDDAADSFNGAYAGLLFTKNEKVTGYNMNSQKYYVSSAYTYEAPDTSEGAEEGATVTTQKNAYGCNDGGKSAGDKFISDSQFAHIVDTFNTLEANAFADDIGINSGKPVLGWQVNNLQLSGNSYEINAEKPMLLSLSEAGYIQLSIKSIADDNAVITITDTAGNVIETKTAGKMGAESTITFDTAEESAVKLTTTGRAVVTKSLLGQTAGSEMTQLTNNNSKIIKLTAPVSGINAGEKVAMVFVHYESSGAVRSINYNETLVAADSTASAKINLSSVTIKANDYLKAYLWDGVTLAPILETPEQLNN